MTTHDDETLEKAAAVTGADPRRLKRLCARCEERMKPSDRTVVCEFVPYVGLRMHASCLAELEAERVPEDE